ncbi:MAG: type II toxin-antitoxin system VapC family toxin [Gemmataceae bacterium]
METVYLETSFISYLVARPSGDLLVAAHQKTTQDWWSGRRSAFNCYVSQVVIDEASAGDPVEAKKRLAVVNTLAALDLTPEAETLTQAIMASGVLPVAASRDAAHVAVAAFHRVDYLLTWNCKHLANAQIMRKIESVCRTSGYRMPIICTPEELMGA